MISRLFDNDETFPERFLTYWESYRAIPAGREESMLKKMVYFHNCLFPDFAIGECFNCGSRWKRAEDRLDIAYNILKEEFSPLPIIEVVEEDIFLNETPLEEVKRTKKKKSS